MANRQISSVLNTAKSFMLYFTDGLNRKEKKSIHIAVRVTIIVIQIIKFPREYTPFASSGFSWSLRNKFFQCNNYVSVERDFDLNYPKKGKIKRERGQRGEKPYLVL